MDDTLDFLLLKKTGWISALFLALLVDDELDSTPAICGEVAESEPLGEQMVDVVGETVFSVKGSFLQKFSAAESSSELTNRSRQ